MIRGPTYTREKSRTVQSRAPHGASQIAAAGSDASSSQATKPGLVRCAIINRR